MLEATKLTTPDLILRHEFRRSFACPLEAADFIVRIPGRELSTNEPKHPSQNTERRMTDRYLLSTCAESRGYRGKKGLFITGGGAVQGTTSRALRWAARLVPGVHQLLAARLLLARLPGKLTLRQKRKQEAE